MKLSEIIDETISRGMAKYKASEGKGGNDPERIMNMWDAETKFVLGYVDLSGKKQGESIDFPISLIKRSAEAGFMLAQYIIGNCYDEGYGTNLDKDKALYWWRKAADQGLDDAVEKRHKDELELQILVKKIPELKIIRERIAKFQGCISAGYYHTVGLKVDGTVISVGNNKNWFNKYAGQCNTGSWRCIVSVSAGSFHTVGLRANGTVIAVGDNESGQCNTNGWRDIIAVAASHSWTCGLKADGTVVVTGGSSSVSSWRDIVAISSGNEGILGLKKDGTVVLSWNDQSPVNGWSDIVAVSSGYYLRAGLKEYGTVVGNVPFAATQWRDIVAVSAGSNHIAGLKSNGTVVVVGDNESGQCNTNGWKDIVSVVAGTEHTVGLREDGTIIAIGNNANGQCNTSEWFDIGPISEERRIWMIHGLCIYCGGKLAFLGSKCKSCGRKN